jgi:hypothetical protein
MSKSNPGRPQLKRNENDGITRFPLIMLLSAVSRPTTDKGVPIVSEPTMENENEMTCANDELVTNLLATGETMTEFNTRLGQQGLYTEFTRHCREEAGRADLSFSETRKRLAGFYGQGCPVGESEAQAEQERLNSPAVGSMPDVATGSEATAPGGEPAAGQSLLASGETMEGPAFASRLAAPDWR